MTMIDRYTHIEWYHFVSVRELTMWSNCGSLRHVLYVGIWALQVGHSWLHLCKLSFMHLPQKRWLHSGLTSVSVQGSKQTAHSNSSSRNFLRDKRTENNVRIRIIEKNWRCWYCFDARLKVDANTNFWRTAVPVSQFTYLLRYHCFKPELLTLSTPPKAQIHHWKLIGIEKSFKMSHHSTPYVVYWLN